MNHLSTKPKLFVWGDLDGFFGLFIDNLLQLMLIAVLGKFVAGLPDSLITQRILPGAALSIFAGNLFYSYQAYQLAKNSGRSNVTALPYGINTVSLLAFILLIMGPLYQETQNVDLVWKVGLFACFVSGLMETLGSFIGDWLRQHTPRGALLSSLAGVALTFISMGFVFQIFASPGIALLPMIIILACYAGKIRLPFGLPGGFFSVLVGCAIAWISKALGHPLWSPPPQTLQWGFHLPQLQWSLLEFLTQPIGWKYLAVIFPMALFNLIGSLQNLESAEAAGDRYPTRSSLLANGSFSLVAALLGSPFPTTIYIGHPAWKNMGARIGYSILNGSVITLLCLVGGVSWVLQYVPLEATLGILLWIGIVMTAQAFQEVPKSHALGVSVGLIPSLSAWALLLIENTLRVSQTSMLTAFPKFGTDLYIAGLISLSQGFLISSMIWGSITIFISDRQFHKAALWMLVAAIFSQIGLIHGYEITTTGVQNKIAWNTASHFALAYLAGSLFLFLIYMREERRNG
ncbi:MAG: NCS2 family permease [Deltaproteobacteria bacterium]|nr:NCS2 family permease [Deltaproteobacteria bacterium]